MKPLTLAAVCAALALPATAQQSFTATRNGAYTYFNGTNQDGTMWTGTATRNGAYTYFNGGPAQRREIDCTLWPNGTLTCP